MMIISTCRQCGIPIREILIFLWMVHIPPMARILVLFPEKIKLQYILLYPGVKCHIIYKILDLWGIFCLFCLFLAQKAFYCAMVVLD